jgi:hypothetical protein
LQPALPDVVEVREQQEIPARPTPHAALEPLSEFFVSTATAGQYWPRGGSCASGFRFSIGNRGGRQVNRAGAAAASRGVDELSFENESGRRRKTDPTPPADPEHAPRSRKRRSPNGEIGQALRKAYRDAVEETIPPEMLDLLGKLG